MELGTTTDEGNTTELFKTWLRADHEFVVVVCSSPTFSFVFSSGCSQQSSEGSGKTIFFFVQRWDLGSQGGQRTLRVLAKEVKHLGFPWGSSG